MAGETGQVPAGHGVLWKAGMLCRVRVCNVSAWYGRQARCVRSRQECGSTRYGRRVKARWSGSSRCGKAGFARPVELRAGAARQASPVVACQV